MKLARIMNPTQTEVKKDYIHVNVHIVPKSSQQSSFFAKLTDDDEYLLAQDAISPGGQAGVAFNALVGREDQYTAPYFPDLYPKNYGKFATSDQSLNDDMKSRSSSLAEE
jgi:hypothetical protein